MYCNTLQHAATYIISTLGKERVRKSRESSNCSLGQAHSRDCNTLQHTATHCNTLQHTATHCNTLQHTATHILSTGGASKGAAKEKSRDQSTCSVGQAHSRDCNTLQRTVTHCGTLQHATTYIVSPRGEERVKRGEKVQTWHS